MARSRAQRRPQTAAFRSANRALKQRRQLVPRIPPVANAVHAKRPEESGR